MGADHDAAVALDAVARDPLGHVHGDAAALELGCALGQRAAGQTSLMMETGILSPRMAFAGIITFSTKAASSGRSVSIFVLGFFSFAVFPAVGISIRRREVRPASMASQFMVTMDSPLWP